MELIGYKGKPKEAKVKDVKFKVDYPTDEQLYKLEQIQTAHSEGAEINYNLADWNKYVRYYLKYTIKDWDGMTSNGKPLKCKVVDNELDDELWRALIIDNQFTAELYNAIFDILKWDAVEKKS